MGWAVILLPDERADTCARRVWNAAGRAGYGEKLFDGDNRPHVSLTVLETQDGTLDAAVQAFAESTTPVQVAFAAMGSFGENVIYLSPEPTSALLQMNRELSNRLGPLLSLADRYYLPGEFQPHMTVVFNVPEGQFNHAWRVTREHFIPFTAIFNRIAVVKFHPVKIMNIYELRG